MPSPLQLSVQQVDHLLPQTQCGLCGHKAGCLPYAQSILEGEDANKCIPGGQPVADELANLLQRTKLNVEPSVWDIQEDGRPQRVKAIIREDECIGCTKCISACPVDAIIGTGKMMHTIMTDLCTGCELCLEPCPVDCIDLIPDHSPLPTLQERIAEQNDLRSRYKAHLIREQSINQHRNHARPTVKAGTSQQHLQAIIGDQFISDEIAPTQAQQTISPQTTIELAKVRTQIKKLQKQLSVRHDQTKADQLFNLEQQLNALMDA